MKYSRFFFTWGPLNQRNTVSTRDLTKCQVRANFAKFIFVIQVEKKNRLHSFRYFKIMDCIFNVISLCSKTLPRFEFVTSAKMENLEILIVSKKVYVSIKKKDRFQFYFRK